MNNALKEFDKRKEENKYVWYLFLLAFNIGVVTFVIKYGIDQKKDSSILAKTYIVPGITYVLALQLAMVIIFVIIDLVVFIWLKNNKNVRYNMDYIEEDIEEKSLDYELSHSTRVSNCFYVGMEHTFFSRGNLISVIKTKDIMWMYKMRKTDINNLLANLYYIIIVLQNEDRIQLDMKNEDQADEILAFFNCHYSHIKIGK